ncbi:MAG TPA: hypothetical protein VHB47_09820 [Thermoanaerobaculia bacterium]|jgi:hypothetical protein|nr:hypothetical protein [Thermoanaerobaculia bacterium]
MAKWTKELALAELRSLISQIEGLKPLRRFSSQHIRWVTNTLRVLEEVFGGASRYFQSFAQIPWSKAGSFVVPGFNPVSGIESVHQQAYQNQLDSARGLLEAAIDELEGSELLEVYKGKDTGPEASAILRVLQLIERKLRKAVHTVPENERQVQDALEALLLGADIEYSRDTEAFEYSSKAYKPDFTCSRLDLAIEVKLCRREGREKEIIAEINDDILAYGTRYGNQIFVVYDLGHIKDVERFALPLEAQSGVLVRVVKQ